MVVVVVAVWPSNQDNRLYLDNVHKTKVKLLSWLSNIQKIRILSQQKVKYKNQVIQKHTNYGKKNYQKKKKKNGKKMRSEQRKMIVID